MTNKSMLSVERELLQSALSAVEYLALRGDDIGLSNEPVAKELRALLDKPVQPLVADLLLASAHCYVKAAGETRNLARHLQSRIELYFDGEPAGQHQGDPVVGHCAHPPGCKFCSWCGFKAEQTAPVVVVMPERGRIVVNEAIRMDGTELAQVWNACIAEVERLNWVKP